MDKVFGTVKFFSAAKKFGFIIADSGRGEYYFNEHSCIGPIPADGERICFEVGTQPDGRKRAERVTVLSAKAAEPVRP
jgi:cold shock CspA family protein